MGKLKISKIFSGIIEISGIFIEISKVNIS
jgi:hypothetical protein